MLHCNVTVSPEVDKVLLTQRPIHSPMSGSQPDTCGGVRKRGLTPDPRRGVAGRCLTPGKGGGVGPDPYSLFPAPSTTK
jgi:hypothetical protein